MDWVDKNVMITGASGFIGRALFNELQRKHANVHNYDLRVGLDITDERTLNDYMERHEIEIVYHLAAISQVPFANRHPNTAFKTNVLGGMNVVAACHTQRVRKLVIASSDKAYGSSSVPYTAESISTAIYPYDVSKYVVDRMADCYAANYGMDITIARLCNVYGGGDLNWERLIPTLAKAMFRGQVPVQRGTDTMMREWMYITDAVDAYMRLADAPVGIFNFGGDPLTVGDVVKAVQVRLKGLPVDRRYDANFEIEEQRTDDRESKELLGWKRWVEFDQGIDLTLDWYKEYLNKAGG